MSVQTEDHERRRGAPARVWLLVLSALAVGAVGLYLVVGGVWLAVLGGSLYYVAAGAALLATAVLLWRGRSTALWLYAALLLGTLIWALAEAGLDFWALVPRGDILAPLGVWLLALPFLLRRPFAGPRAGQAALGGVLAAVVVVLGLSLTADRHAIRSSLPAAAGSPASGGNPLQLAGQDWPAYGGTGYGDRFSTLDQITPANVGRLKLAWQFQTGDMRGPNDPGETTNEATPLKVGDTLYTCSPHQIVWALDAATGKLRWKFDPHIIHNPNFQHLTCRGVSYHATAPGATAADGSPAPAECPHRIFLPTNDGWMYAINADDGTLCHGFGEDGRVDLKQGEAVQTAGLYEGTSPPVVSDKVLVMGGAVIDNYAKHVPSGTIRGFDIYSGKLLWVFDSGNPDPNQPLSASHPHYTPGSPNEWAPAVVDEKLGLVYVPLGEQSDDIWGGDRKPVMERYDSAMVALDLRTGKLRWSFQNVHHDLWDMDMPSQPSLADILTPGGVVPVIYAPAKTGNIFVIDRRNGHLVVPAPEMPVPQGPAPGDHLSPTQPFSALSFRPREKLTGAQMWGGTMFDQLACRIEFHSLRYEGPFTPPSVQGTLVFPGDFGMFEWGGIAVDPRRQIAIANPMSIPFVSQLIPRGPNNPPAPNGKHPAGTEWGVQPMYGAPFGVRLGAFLSPLGIPCLQPPWGNIAALDLRTDKIVWQHRIGTIRDMAPVPVPLALGVPMLGGPMVTASGVAFITSTMDYYIRAFDVSNGRLLWQDRLPAGGQSTPMSYSVGGRQYVATVDGGHGSFGTKLGDYIRAYTLSD